MLKIKKKKHFFQRYRDKIIYLEQYCFPGSSAGKESACNGGGPGLIPGSGRSPGEEIGYPLQYSCLENPRIEEHGSLQFMGSQRVGHD